MTSTNDGKDVKSNQTSGQKGKTYYIELYKSLEARLSGECSGEERTRHVCEAWRRVHCLCLHSAPSTHPHLLSWLQRHTSHTILQTEWQSPKSKEQHTWLEEAINEFISECKDALSKRGGVSQPWEIQLLQRARWFLTVLPNPWGHPVLKALLDSRGPNPSDGEVLQWLKEERGVIFVARLRQLAAARCDDLALLLAAAVMNRARFSARIVPDADQADDQAQDKPETINEFSFQNILRKEAGFTTEVWELLTDIEFVLLYKGESRARCIELAKLTPLRNGYKLVERLHNRLENSPQEKKLWKNAKDVATLIAQVVIARCMVVPQCAGVARAALYGCVYSLVRLLPAERLPTAAAALAAPAATSRHLHTLAAAVHAQCKEERKPFVCSLYVRAITAGMNELEKLKLDTEKASEARAIEQTLASWFIQLGSLLSASSRLNCECTLTAFSVHPSPTMYERVKRAPPLAPLIMPDIQEQDTETNSEYGSWATDSRTQTNLVKTSETLKIKQTQKQANVLSTAIFAEGEGLGLEADLCQDLAVLLSGPRVKTLYWDMDREVLLENCRTYMERTHGGTRALTTELKYLNLDPNCFQHLPEEEDEDENDIYYGIEKGYEHLVELEEPEPEDVICDDIMTDYSETTDSVASIEELPMLIPKRKKKKKKQSQIFSEEEVDPLSLVCDTFSENKDIIHSKERSKHKNKEKSKTKSKIDHTKEHNENNGIVDEINKDIETKVKKKQKKERKKKNKLNVCDVKIKDQNFQSSSNLSRLVGMKIASSNVSKIERRNLNPNVNVCTTDSDYDSQGKSSINSEYSENALNEVLHSMDDTKLSQKTLTVDSQRTSFPLTSCKPTTITSVKKDVKKSIQKLIEYRRHNVFNDNSINRDSSECYSHKHSIDQDFLKSKKLANNMNSSVIDTTGVKYLDKSHAPVKHPTADKNESSNICLTNNEGNFSSKKKMLNLSLQTTKDRQSISANERFMKKRVPRILKPQQPSQMIKFNETPSQKQYQEFLLQRKCIAQTQDQILTSQLQGQVQFQEFLKKQYLQSNEPSISTSIAQDLPKQLPSQEMNKNVTSSQVQFQNFLKELQDSINAGATNEMRDSKCMHALQDKTATKKRIQTKKLDNAANTYARLSYMHKNKHCESKLKVANKLFIQNKPLANVTAEEIGHIKDIDVEKVSYLQSKGDIVLSKVVKPKNKCPIEKPKVLVQNIENISDCSTSVNNLLNKTISSDMLPSDNKITEYTEPGKTEIEAIKQFNMPTPKTSTSFLSEKDQFDLLLLLRQQSKMNPPKIPVKTEVPSTPSGILIKNGTSHCIDSEKQCLDLHNKTPILEEAAKSTFCPTSVIKVTNNKTLNNGSEPKKNRAKGFKQKIKNESDWKSVMDDLLAHKTPSMIGPNALDVVLKKDSFEKRSSECLNNPNCKSVITSINKTKIINNENIAKHFIQDKQTASASKDSLFNLKSAHTENLKHDVVQSPNKIRSIDMVKKRPTHIQSKHFPSVIQNSYDPFISGIPNSDYDLLEELMDDDLRQEIGELSSDEETYRNLNLSTSKTKNTLHIKESNLPSTKISAAAAGNPFNLSSISSSDSVKKCTNGITIGKKDLSIKSSSLPKEIIRKNLDSNNCANLKPRIISNELITSSTIDKKSSPSGKVCNNIFGTTVKAVTSNTTNLCVENAPHLKINPVITTSKTKSQNSNKMSVKSCSDSNLLKTAGNTKVLINSVPAASKVKNVLDPAQVVLTVPQRNTQQAQAQNIMLIGSNDLIYDPFTTMHQTTQSGTFSDLNKNTYVAVNQAPLNVTLLHSTPFVGPVLNPVIIENSVTLPIIQKVAPNISTNFTLLNSRNTEPSQISKNIQHLNKIKSVTIQSNTSNEENEKLCQSDEDLKAFKLKDTTSRSTSADTEMSTLRSNCKKGDTIAGINDLQNIKSNIKQSQPGTVKVLHLDTKSESKVLGDKKCPVNERSDINQLVDKTLSLDIKADDLLDHERIKNKRSLLKEKLGNLKNTKPIALPYVPIKSSKQNMKKQEIIDKGANKGNLKTRRKIGDKTDSCQKQSSAQMNKKVYEDKAIKNPVKNDCLSKNKNVPNIQKNRKNFKSDFDENNSSVKNKCEHNLDMEFKKSCNDTHYGYTDKQQQFCKENIRELKESAKLLNDHVEKSIKDGISLIPAKIQTFSVIKNSCHKLNISTETNNSSELLNCGSIFKECTKETPSTKEVDVNEKNKFTLRKLTSQQNNVSANITQQNKNTHKLEKGKISKDSSNLVNDSIETKWVDIEDKILPVVIQSTLIKSAELYEDKISLVRDNNTTHDPKMTTPLISIKKSDESGKDFNGVNNTMHDQMSSMMSQNCKFRESDELCKDFVDVNSTMHDQISSPIMSQNCTIKKSDELYEDKISLVRVNNTTHDPKTSPLMSIKESDESGKDFDGVNNTTHDQISSPMMSQNCTIKDSDEICQDFVDVNSTTHDQISSPNMSQNCTMKKSDELYEDKISLVRVNNTTHDPKTSHLMSIKESDESGKDFDGVNNTTHDQISSPMMSQKCTIKESDELCQDFLGVNNTTHDQITSLVSVKKSDVSSKDLLGDNNMTHDQIASPVISQKCTIKKSDELCEDFVDVNNTKYDKLIASVITQNSTIKKSDELSEDKISMVDDSTKMHGLKESPLISHSCVMKKIGELSKDENSLVGDNNTTPSQKAPSLIFQNCTLINSDILGKDKISLVADSNTINTEKVSSLISENYTIEKSDELCKDKDELCKDKFSLVGDNTTTQNKKQSFPISQNCTIKKTDELCKENISLVVDNNMHDQTRSLSMSKNSALTKSDEFCKDKVSRGSGNITPNPSQKMSISQNFTVKKSGGFVDDKKTSLGNHSKPLEKEVSCSISQCMKPKDSDFDNKSTAQQKPTGASNITKVVQEILGRKELDINAEMQRRRGNNSNSTIKTVTNTHPETVEHRKLSKDVSIKKGSLNLENDPCKSGNNLLNAKITYEELPNPSNGPQKRCVRIKLPNGNSFKATISGKSHVSLDSIFEDPTVKSLLWKNINNNTKCTLNIKQSVVSLRNKKQPPILKTVVKSICPQRTPQQNEAETINLISDDEEDIQPQSFKTEIGNFKVKSLDPNIHLKHQKKLSQKSVVILERYNALQEIVPDVETNIESKKLDKVNIPSEKPISTPEIVKDYIEIEDDSSNDSVTLVSVTNTNENNKPKLCGEKVDELKNLLLKDLGVEVNDDKIPKGVLNKTQRIVENVDKINNDNKIHIEPLNILDELKKNIEGNNQCTYIQREAQNIINEINRNFEVLHKNTGILEENKDNMEKDNRTESEDLPVRQIESNSKQVLLKIKKCDDLVEQLKIKKQKCFVSLIRCDEALLDYQRKIDSCTDNKETDESLHDALCLQNEITIPAETTLKRSDSESILNALCDNTVDLSLSTNNEDLSDPMSPSLIHNLDIPINLNEYILNSSDILVGLSNKICDADWFMTKSFLNKYKSLDNPYRDSVEIFKACEIDEDSLTDCDSDLDVNLLDVNVDESFLVPSLVKLIVNLLANDPHLLERYIEKGLKSENERTMNYSPLKRKANELVEIRLQNKISEIENHLDSEIASQSKRNCHSIRTNNTRIQNDFASKNKNSKDILEYDCKIKESGNQASELKYGIQNDIAHIQCQEVASLLQIAIKSFQVMSEIKENLTCVEDISCNSNYILQTLSTNANKDFYFGKTSANNATVALELEGKNMHDDCILKTRETLPDGEQLKTTCSFDVLEDAIVYHSEISENISNRDHSPKDSDICTDPHSNDDDDDMQARSFVDNKNNAEPCLILTKTRLVSQPKINLKTHIHNAKNTKTDFMFSEMKENCNYCIYNDSEDSTHIKETTKGCDFSYNTEHIHELQIDTSTVEIQKDEQRVNDLKKNLVQDIKLLDKPELLINTQFQNDHYLHDDCVNVTRDLKTLTQTLETSVKLHQKYDIKMEDKISPACSFKELEMEIANTSEYRENDTYADDKYKPLKILQLDESSVIDAEISDNSCFSKDIDVSLNLAENNIFGAEISDSDTRIYKEKDERLKLAKNNIEIEISDSDTYIDKKIDATVKLAKETTIDAEISESETSFSKETDETLKLAENYVINEGSSYDSCISKEIDETSKNYLVETEISDSDTCINKEFDITLQITENNIINSKISNSDTSISKKTDNSLKLVERNSIDAEISDSDTKMNNQIDQTLKLAENNMIENDISDSDICINKEIDVTLKLDENNIINSEISESDTSISKEIDGTLKMGESNVTDVQISDSDSCRKKYTTNENGWLNNSDGIHINDDEILKGDQDTDIAINTYNERNLETVGHKTNTKLFEINCDQQKEIDNTFGLNPRTNMKKANKNFYINENTNLSDHNEDMRPLENLKSEILQSKTPRKKRFDECFPDIKNECIRRKKATNVHAKLEESFQCNVLSKDLQITTKMTNLPVAGSENIGNKTNRTGLKKDYIQNVSSEYTAADTNNINETNETEKSVHTNNPVSSNGKRMDNVKCSNSIDGVFQNHRDFENCENLEGIFANNEMNLTKESIENENAVKVESGSSNDKKLQKNVTLVYKGDSNVILKGSIYEDPVVGICYVFPAINRTSSTDDMNCSGVCDNKTIDAIKKINSNVSKDSNNLDISEDVQIVETFNLILPKVTYSRQRFKNNENIDMDDKTNRKNLKRKLSGYDNKCNAKRYRKGKNIDYPKFSPGTAYSKQYKRLFDYCTSVKFSYSRCFHKEYINVSDILKDWPIKETDMNVPDNTDLENTLFSEEQFENKVAFDPLQQTLAEEISQCNEHQYISCDVNETNFNMGFGEGSDRVIQISEDGNNISKFSAATLSDVKQSQPCLTSEEYGNCNKNQILCTSHKHQIEILKRSISYIKLRDKVRSFFKKTTAELNYHWLMDTMKSKYKNSYNNSIFLSGFPYDLISSDFIEPPPVEAVVQVVQVGQLPVSAAAQNPVTCDPRVTQVTDASPQCSIENSPHDDSQSPIKTEYTELTTADLSLPLVHDYDRHMESQESSKMPNSHHEDIPVETEITSIVKTEITVELSPLKEEPIDYNDSDDLQSLVNKHINNVDYSFDSNDNSILETQSNTDISYESLENHETDFSPQEKQNCSAEKTDQIAHAMNAAGITTTPETNINTRTHSLVNMLPLKNCQEAPAVTTAPSVNNYSKTPVNAMTLQQALAQILPPPLNQTNVHENNQTNTNSSVTSQVLHIVQGKNTNSNQITLVDNSQNSVISNTNTPVLHIVQNKGASANSTPNANSGQHGNSYSGLSLVDAGIQQGSNQLLHIVNTGNQKNNSPGQLLKRVNLLTNLTNVQGSNEQKMVQFVCKSADGKSIHLNAPHQRSMVLRLQPIESSNIQTNPKATECQDNTSSCPTSNTNNATSNKESSNAQHEIKSRSVYEENYAKFIQNSSNKSVEKSTSLPKFGQAFGKQVFQDGNQKGNDINANNSNLSSINSTSESSECQANDNSVNLDHIGQINSPPLLLRKSPSQPAQSQSSQANLVQQIKQTIAPMNIQTMHGGVIYTRQIPVNIGGGQTINLITVPSTELIDEANQKQKGDVKFVNQNELDSPIIKIVPQNQNTANAEGSRDETNNHSGLPNENAQNTPAQHQTVLTQMRIKLPMLSKTPQMVSGARVVRPSFFQIQRNVIGGANQHVYQQLVLTAAPPLGQHTIRLPAQANRQTTKTTADGQATSEPQMSSSTLEQLREFDMVLEQVKERSTVQPNSNSNTFTKMLTPTTETSEGTSVTSTVTESTQQVLYSIGSNQSLNVAYINRKTVATTPTTSTFVRSPDSTGIIDTPSSSHVQIPHTVTSESTLNEASSQPNQAKPAKVGSKSKSRPKSSSNPPNSLKINTLPPKPTQKPLEDEQTTQRILYILAEYKEQVENSPDKDKPAPRRRSNPPTTSSGSSKRKKSSSGSRRPGARDMSPVHGEDTCRTMGSEDSSCGTSQGDCNESCLDSHSPQDSPRKVVRKLTFENETSPVAQPRPQPQRNVIVADGQTITVARGTTGKPATAVLMPANYILPVSMVKGGQQIAIVTNRGPKLLTVGGGEGGATNALLLQRLIGPAGLKPVLTRPGVRHVRLPTAALHNLQAFNLTAATSAPPPDSTASPAPAPTPPELIETRATGSPWTDRESQDVKPERESSPEGSEPWNLPSSADPHDYTYEETVRTDNMDRTVLESIPDRYSPDMEAQRIFDKMFDVESKKSYIDSHDDSSRCAYDIDASDCDDKVYHQVVHKKDGTSQRHHRLTHVSAAALRHKYAILEHELRLQKSLSEECEDLGVDSPSASELFPEAELLFAASPAHDAPHHSHTPQPTILNQSGIPQPDIDDQIATDELLQQDVHEDQQELDVSTLGLDEGIVTVSEDGMQATIALDQEEFARSHPNTTFHSEPTDEGEVQPFTIAGLKGRHITSTIFHAGRAPATVLVTAPPTTVISQADPDHAMPNNVKYMDQIINSSPATHGNLNLSSVLVKDDGLTKFDNILTDSRELHLSNTASAIVHSTGNATQVIRRVCYEDDKRDTRFLMDEPDALIAGDDAKMIAEDSSRDATLESIAGDVDDDNSSPERHAELFWESNSASERSESRRPMDFSSDSEKCCKSPSYDETNSTDSSGVGTHMRLDSVIKDARGIERSGSADGSSADDTHPPLRTYPAKRMYHALDGQVERSMSGKTRAGERSPDSLEVRRRASGRGVVKRGCHCCTGSPAPPRPKKSRQRKPAMDFTN